MSLPASDTSKQPDNLTTMDLGEVLPRTAEVRDNHLFIGGVDMVKLAREEGTALYVFDEADLRWRMETYREAFLALRELRRHLRLEGLPEQGGRAHRERGGALPRRVGRRRARLRPDGGLPDGARFRAWQQQDAG